MSQIKLIKSIAFIFSYKSGLSGTYEISFLAFTASLTIDFPLINISPLSKLFIPTIDLIVVVLPAPL